MPEPLTSQQLDLDAIEAVVRNAAQLGADIDPGTAAALVDEVRRLRAQVVDLGDENAKLIRWHREDGAYEQRLREQHDRDVAELSSVRAERDQARARIAELERPAVEAKRNEIRQSYSELIAQCEQDRDFEGAFDVQCRLREREEQWAAEDAANQPTAPAARSAAV